MNKRKSKLIDFVNKGRVQEVKKKLKNYNFTLIIVINIFHDVFIAKYFPIGKTKYLLDISF